VIAVSPVPKKEIKQFGVIKGLKLEDRVYQVKEIIEKPKPSEAPSNLAVVGRYVVTPELLKELENFKPKPGEEKGITDGLQALMKKRPLYACEIKGEWYTCGDKLGFLKANLVFGLKDKKIGKELRGFLRKIS